MNTVVKDGYTLTCTSWENDGDNYNTRTLVVQDKEVAKTLKEMCDTVFQSENNGDGGIGNGFNVRSDHGEMMADFMRKHPAICNGETEDDALIDICMEYNGKLLGYSEVYDSRISESCVVTFSDKDITVQEVQF